MKFIPAKLEDIIAMQCKECLSTPCLCRKISSSDSEEDKKNVIDDFYTEKRWKREEDLENLERYEYYREKNKFIKNRSL